MTQVVSARIQRIGLRVVSEPEVRTGQCSRWRSRYSRRVRDDLKRDGFLVDRHLLIPDCPDLQAALYEVRPHEAMQRRTYAQLYTARPWAIARLVRRGR